MRKGIFYLLPLFTILLTTVYSCGDNNEDTPPNVSPSVTIPESENLHPTLSQKVVLLSSHSQLQVIGLQV